MEQHGYRKLAALAQTPEAVEQSIAYLYDRLRRFLRKRERVLILFDKHANDNCKILEEALRRCECIPMWIGGDRRWVTLLKTAFTSRCTCLVGSPLTLLGLSKLAKYMDTPLYVKNVLMAGYPTTKWLVNGVCQGLDCMAWGCFDPGPGSMISGFTCSQLDGVHIRETIFGVDIVDEQDHVLPRGEFGRVVLYLKEDPSVRFAVGDVGRIETAACSCGSTSSKIIDMDVVKDNPALSDLGESLHLWSSILDCRMEKTEYGLELEMVVFPGEKLPKLPTAAKLVVRPFNPETDEPFDHLAVLKKRYLSLQNH